MHNKNKQKTASKKNQKNRIYENLNPKDMWKFITDNITEFWRGTIAFSFTGFGFITFQKIIVLDLFVGIMVTVISGALGGMATALGANYYKHKIHHKLFKNKKDVSNKRTDKDKAA